MRSPRWMEAHTSRLRLGAQARSAPPGTAPASGTTRCRTSRLFRKNPIPIRGQKRPGPPATALRTTSGTRHRTSHYRPGTRIRPQRQGQCPMSAASCPRRGRRRRRRGAIRRPGEVPRRNRPTTRGEQSNEPWRDAARARPSVRRHQWRSHRLTGSPTDRVPLRLAPSYCRCSRSHRCVRWMCRQSRPCQDGDQGDGDLPQVNRPGPPYNYSM